MAFWSPESNKSGAHVDPSYWRRAIGVSDAEVSENAARNEFQTARGFYDKTIHDSGFYHWLEPDDSGHAATYTHRDKTKFVLLNQILNGNVAARNLTGDYRVNGHEVSVNITEDSTDSPIVSYHVYLDSKLIAMHTNPFDTAQMQATAFLREHVASRGEDTARLEVAESVSPYPFVVKMIQDFQHSKPDDGRIKQMFKRMSKKGLTVWVKDSAS